MPTTALDDDWIWWEGEDPVATNFPDRTWFSSHILCTNLLFTLTARTSASRPVSSSYLSATAEISVAQTKVKSPG